MISLGLLFLALTPALAQGPGQPISQPATDQIQIPFYVPAILQDEGTIAGISVGTLGGAVTTWSASYADPAATGWLAAVDTDDFIVIQETAGLAGAVQTLTVSCNGLLGAQATCLEENDAAGLLTTVTEQNAAFTTLVIAATAAVSTTTTLPTTTSTATSSSSTITSPATVASASSSGSVSGSSSSSISQLPSQTLSQNVFGSSATRAQVFSGLAFVGGLMACWIAL